MNFSDLADSVANIAEHLSACPICGTEARVKNGSCVGCLLRSGLEDAEGGDAESFEAILEELVLRTAVESSPTHAS